ncbi:ODC1, partial [Cordylochernes scorpioides]
MVCVQLTMNSISNGVLDKKSLTQVTDRPLAEVIREVALDTDQEDPFFVVNLDEIVGRHLLWKSELPDIHPFYAVKCNDSPVVIKLLAGLGVNFDCASLTEIKAVLALGVDPSRIIFANPCKSSSYIKYAAKVGVDMMTFDNEIELEKIKNCHPGAQVVLRLKVDDSQAMYQLGPKFGCHLSQARKLFATAKSLELDVLGVSFHVGSGCMSAEAFPKAIADAREAFDIAHELGLNPTLLDIGGGYPGSEQPPPMSQFEDMAASIRDSVEKYFPESCGVRVISEPGKFFVHTSFTLATKVIAKRPADIIDDTGEPTAMYYLNDGVFGTFICVIFEPTHFEPFPLVNRGRKPGPKCIVWGPTCDSYDKVMESNLLPDLEVGEWLAFPDQGSYTSVLSTPFNGFPNPIPRRLVLSTKI